MTPQMILLVSCVVVFLVAMIYVVRDESARHAALDKKVTEMGATSAELRKLEIRSWEDFDKRITNHGERLLAQDRKTEDTFKAVREQMDHIHKRLTVIGDRPRDTWQGFNINFENPLQLKLVEPPKKKPTKRKRKTT